MTQRIIVDWAEHRHKALSKALLAWLKQKSREGLDAEQIVAMCPNGHWLLSLAQQMGFPADQLAEAVRPSQLRAVQEYAPAALDKLGLCEYAEALRTSPDIGVLKAAIDAAAKFTDAKVPAYGTQVKIWLEAGLATQAAAHARDALEAETPAEAAYNAVCAAELMVRTPCYTSQAAADAARAAEEARCAQEVRHALSIPELARQWHIAAKQHVREQAARRVRAQIENFQSAPGLPVQLGHVYFEYLWATIPPDPDETWSKE
jgi:hypothetical protein